MTCLVVIDELQNQFRLKRVALLYDLSRLHFTLESTRVLVNNQLAEGEDLFETESDNKYTITVKFSSEMPGFFNQRVIFDFGCRPVVGRTLSVNMHRTVECQERVLSLQQDLQLARWASDNCSIVPFSETAAVPADELEVNYRLPSDINEIINTETVNSELNRNNYTHRMHSLLMLEEYTRMKIVSR